ncbi:unnamed protein product [Mytilus coruscus]|uniref:OTU domain-containing protein n=1 Tax=Mytilus coruscus TaxID=42192 RepID=A0A6J8BF98_MYTCO|nr:unnamed protein product [Mytilus coruscus]
MYIDNVLIMETKYIANIHGDNVHLLVSDLPGMIEMSGKLLKISRKESITAVVDNYGTIDFSEFGNSLPLDQTLQESLIDYDACFICAYDTTFLALKHNQDLLLFDSHARNKFGLKDSDGKSLLLKLNNLDHLYQYCCNMMAGSSQNQWFEGNQLLKRLSQVMEIVFFRAISYALSNRQEFFGDIRRAIVDHLITNAEIFRSFYSQDLNCRKHIQTLKMEEKNVWGTELEILACADLLKTDIYTFNSGTWIKYSASQINSNNCVNDQAIYLQHIGDINHYEVVTNVKQKSSLQIHYNVDKVMRKIKLMKI